MNVAWSFILKPSLFPRSPLILLITPIYLARAVSSLKIVHHVVSTIFFIWPCYRFTDTIASTRQSELLTSLPLSSSLLSSLPSSSSLAPSVLCSVDMYSISSGRTMESAVPNLAQVSQGPLQRNPGSPLQHVALLPYLKQLSQKAQRWVSSATRNSSLEMRQDRIATWNVFWWIPSLDFDAANVERWYWIISQAEYTTISFCQHHRSIRNIFYHTSSWFHPHITTLTCHPRDTFQTQIP